MAGWAASSDNAALITTLSSHFSLFYTAQQNFTQIVRLTKTDLTNNHRKFHKAISG